MVTRLLPEQPQQTFTLTGVSYHDDIITTRQRFLPRYNNIDNVEKDSILLLLLLLNRRYNPSITTQRTHLATKVHLISGYIPVSNHRTLRELASRHAAVSESHRSIINQRAT